MLIFGNDKAEQGNDKAVNGLTTTSITRQESSHLLFVTDCNTKVHYLVDTGAEICVVPPTLDDRRRQHVSPLL